MNLLFRPAARPIAIAFATGIATIGVAQNTGMLLPYDVPAAASNGTSAMPTDCLSGIPDPIVTLKLESIYSQSDQSRSQIDAGAKKVYDGKLKPVRDFTFEITNMANKYVASGGKDVGNAKCALEWLSAWAREDALAQLETRQSNLSVTRIIAGLALAYTQLPRGLPGMAVSQRDDIEKWLQRRAEAVMATHGSDKKRKSDVQNHRYWSGLAVASVGVATGRKDLLDWGVESYRIGVCQISADGSLPLELARGSRARDYHLHALMPLVMIAELAEANGLKAYAICDGAIHRLVQFSIEAVEDTSQITKLADEKQVPLPLNEDGTIRGDRIAWIEPYLKRFPSQDWLTKLKFKRPLKSSKIGGNLTLLYGA
jgi:poly(beta-D-mannuronate) lyase